MAKKDIPNSRETVGSGFIIIPEQIDRQEYIDFAKATQQVTILTSDGNYIPDVFILNHVMDELVYPDSFRELGSQVLFVVMPYDSKPIIIGTLPKQGGSRFIGEGEFNIKRSVGDSVVEISGSAKGDLNIVLNTNFKANLNVKCYGSESLINIETDGKTQIKASENVTVQSFNDVNIEAVNIDGEKLSKIYLKDGKIILNEGTEPMLLGDTTQEQLDKEKKAVSDILSAFSNLVPVPVPPNALDPTWATLQAVLASIIDRGDFSGIKSENCSLD